MRTREITVLDTSPKAPSLYKVDFYAWANQQAALLRAGRLGEADIANIAEKIETLGRGEKRELINRLAALIMHLLKWQYQPRKRGKSWRLTIAVQRVDVADHLAENPSLKAQMDEALRYAYRRAHAAAATETELDPDIFPKACPWTYDEIIDDAFGPEA